MGLLDNYTGIGMSPRPKWQHQNVIRRAICKSYDELESQSLFMLSEATVTDDWDDLAPDLVIFDNRYDPLSIIEITTHKELRKIITKCYELINRFPAAEYFVYDYEKTILYKFNLETEEWNSSSIDVLYSDYLTSPLLDYLL